ncbi:nucleotidyltransferase family protein [Bacillus sp. JJ1609]|uniref:nucleotidyltransferase family protein n=1 Tax=Bacillus sp. JJ1609 TaxID=3122977 RepID=UPI002FFFEC42
MPNQLLEALYLKETALPIDEYYYKKLIDNKDFVSIAPQIYHLLKEQGMLGEVTDDFYLYLKKHYLQTLQLNLFVKHQMTQILHSFEEYGLEVIPLKGVCLAESYFGNIGARRTSDIDLLIKYRDLEQAIDMIKQLGFTTEEEKIPGHFHCSYSKKLPGSEIPLVVELHWDLLKESTANFNIKDFWSEAKPYGKTSFIKELSSFHVFYMIVLHGWRHNLDSYKYYLDIIHLIHFFKDELDFAKLMETAKAHKTQRRIIRTLTAVYQEFPFLDKIKPFPFKANKQYLYLSEKKDGNSFYKKYADYIDYQYFSYDLSGHIVKEILSTILPAKK